MLEALRISQTHSRLLQLITLVCFTAMAITGWQLLTKQASEPIRVNDYHPILTADEQDTFFYQDENFDLHGLVGPNSPPKEAAKFTPRASQEAEDLAKKQVVRKRRTLEEDGLYGGWESTEILDPEPRPTVAAADKESLSVKTREPVPTLPLNKFFDGSEDAGILDSAEVTADEDLPEEDPRSAVAVEEDDDALLVQSEPPPKQTVLEALPRLQNSEKEKSWTGFSKDLAAAGRNDDRLSADTGSVNNDRLGANAWPRDEGGDFKQVDPSQSRASGKLQLRDFVVATTSHRGNEPMLAAGRASRLGMHTYVATNFKADNKTQYAAMPDETWGFFPDDDPVRSFYAGDSRAALVPFMAYKELGDSFKWLFYGDDDTAFFVNAAINVVQSLDHSMPYIITDNLWFSERWVGARHPHDRALRCLPCNYARNTSQLHMKMAIGCPCTPRLMCNTKGGYQGVLNPHSCGAPRTPVYTYSMHGGAGALISVGLLRNVPWDSMQKCIKHQFNSGGDAFLTTCLWQHGLGITDVDPLWHPEGLTMFDPSPPPLNPDDFIVPKAAKVLAIFLREAAGLCQGLCKLELDHTVTLHLRARRVGGSDIAAAAFVRAVSRFYANFTGRASLATSNVAKLNDTTDERDTRLAAEVDTRFKAAVETIKAMGPLYLAQNLNRMTSGKGGASVKSTTDDTAFAGAATGIATRLLELMLEEARVMVENTPPPPVPPSPKPPIVAQNASMVVSMLLAASGASAIPELQKNATLPGLKKNATLPGLQKNATLPGLLKNATLPGKRRQRRRKHRKQAARSTTRASIATQ